MRSDSNQVRTSSTERLKAKAMAEQDLPARKAERRLEWRAGDMGGLYGIGTVLQEGGLDFVRNFCHSTGPAPIQRELNKYMQTRRGLSSDSWLEGASDCDNWRQR